MDAAGELVHLNGYGATTLADVAGVAGVPLGNVYYYFKTKDSLASALIAARSEVDASLRDEWERTLGPRDRLLAFVAMTLSARSELTRSGCPIGTLCSELRKTDGPLGAEAGRLFSGWLDWLGMQFEALGGDRRKAAAQALRLLAELQGATVLTHALGSSDVLAAVAARSRQWIESL